MVHSNKPTTEYKGLRSINIWHQSLNLNPYLLFLVLFYWKAKDAFGIVGSISKKKLPTVHQPWIHLEFSITMYALL